MTFICELCYQRQTRLANAALCLTAGCLGRREHLHRISAEPWEGR